MGTIIFKILNVFINFYKVLSISYIQIWIPKWF